MKDNDFMQKLVSSEIEGKNNAIHAYDKMVWTVRSGFLTLIFAGWSIAVKAAIESHASLIELIPYFFVLSIFSLSLAIGAYRIDRNYARRKFRVITALNHLIQVIMNTESSKMESINNNELTQLLSISGDADNDSYKMQPYYNEINISRIIYGVPSLVITGIFIYYIFIYRV